MSRYETAMMDSDSDSSVVDLTISSESDDDSVVLLSSAAEPSPSKTRY